jgi:hypothetical protein
MPKDKYTLPVVDSLKEIGFRFEYAKLSDVFPYMRSFVAANIESLILLYYPDQCIYDDDRNTVDLIRWADPNMFDDILYDEKTEKEIIDKILRIEKGNIKIEDYALVVHAKFRKDKDVLLKALNRKLRSIYGATGNLIYRRGIWDLDFILCIQECLYHRVLDDLILFISYQGTIKPSKWNPQYFNYQEKKGKADKYKADHPGKNRSLSVASYYLEADKELMNFSNELFSSNFTKEKNARNLMRKALIGSPILTHIENKEKTISYYLGLQAGSVNTSKDNSKSNKGIQQSKRQAVIDSYKADPKKPIVQIILEIYTDENNNIVSLFFIYIVVSGWLKLPILASHIPGGTF